MILAIAAACGGTAATPVVVEKEVIKEIEKEVIVEKEVIKEVEKQVIVEKEVIREVEKPVIIEKEVVKEVYVEVSREERGPTPIVSSIRWSGSAPTTYNEHPTLAAMVKAGQLPPV
ncbi:MAG: hypothetical protein MK125_02280, partial [Dehalococcoidia bacterium]|nr:hypothetical protein [Dehalococcoidia bacterium]